MDIDYHILENLRSIYDYISTYIWPCMQTYTRVLENYGSVYDHMCMTM